MVENNTDMAEGTAKKILRKLIEKDKKVICVIDDANPRIHHLYINGPEISEMWTKKFILSKIEEQINNHMRYKTVQLETGEWISIAFTPHLTKLNYPNAFEIMDNLIKRQAK